MAAARGWRDLKRVINNGGFASGRPVIGLDFDGTLAPLRRQPLLARLPDAIRVLLAALAAKRGVQLAVLSGRSLKDVKEKIGLPGIFYGGNHGLEIEGPRVSWRHPSVRAASGQLRRLAARLRRSARGLRGAHVEDKGLTLSVHYRGIASRELRGVLRGRIQDAMPSRGRRLRLAAGKKVWEILPRVEWNKGHALLKILRLSGGRRSALFVGDDAADEEGFRTLGPRAVTVRVGRPRRSFARYRLRDRRQVADLLDFLRRTLP